MDIGSAKVEYILYANGTVDIFIPMVLMIM